MDPRYSRPRMPLPQLPPLDFSSPNSSPTRPTPSNRLPTSIVSPDPQPPLLRKLSMKRSVSNASSLSEQRLRERKSKTASLFQTFSRPNVERARGYTEQDVNVNNRQGPVVRESWSSVQSMPSAHAISDKAPSPRTKTPSPKRPSALRIRSTPTPQHRNVASYDPPPLFQAYPQAVKYASLEAADQSIPVSTETRKQHIRNMASMDGLRNRQSTDLGRSKRAPQPNRGLRKVYVLVNAGWLLEYAGDGPFDRPAEAVLKLGKDSAAFASDTVPGKPWVLQVVQASTNAPPPRILRPQKSFFSRIGMQKESARPVSSLLLVCEGAEDLNEWMTAIRKQIEVLGGKRYHTPGHRRTSIDEDGQAISPSHRYPVMLRTPTEGSEHSSPVSVHLSEARTSTNTLVGTASERSGRTPSRKFSDPPRLSFYANSDNYDLMPEVPAFEVGTPTDSFATLSVSSSPNMPDEISSDVHHDTVCVSSAWDASLQMSRPESISMMLESPQIPTNWPLPQHYPKSLTIDFHAATTTLPKAMIPLRESSSTANMQLQTSPTSRKHKSGAGARLSLYPQPLRIAVSPQALAEAQIRRSSSSRTTSPTSARHQIPTGATISPTLRRPPSMLVRTDPTPFLSLNRPKAPRAPASTIGLGMNGVETGRNGAAEIGTKKLRLKGRRSAPMLLSMLPPPSAPPTRPLPKLPVGIAVDVVEGVKR